jgi:hypothetical protein
VIHGVIEIAGVDHHLMFLRVEDDENGSQRPTRDPYNRYGDLQRLRKGKLRTIKVPNHRGEWICHIYPFHI